MMQDYIVQYAVKGCETIVKTSGKAITDKVCIVCGMHATCSSKNINNTEEYRCITHYEDYCNKKGVKIK